MSCASERFAWDVQHFAQDMVEIGGTLQFSPENHGGQKIGSTWSTNLCTSYVSPSFPSQVYIDDWRHALRPGGFWRAAAGYPSGSSVTFCRRGAVLGELGYGEVQVFFLGGMVRISWKKLWENCRMILFWDQNPKKDGISTYLRMYFKIHH